MLGFCVYIYILYSSFCANTFYLPLYFQHQGYSPGQIGTIVGAGSLVAIFGQPFWGFQSDKRKTIKRILYLLIPMAWILGIGIYFTHVFALTFGFMFLFMFFFSSMGPLSDSLTIQFAYHNNRNYSSIRLWGELGVGTSSLVLGLFTQKMGIAYLPWGFYALSAVALLALFKVEDARPNAVPVSLKSVKKLIGNRKFLLFLAFVLIVAVPHRMNDGMLGLYIASLGGKESLVGYAWLAGTASSALAMSLMSKVLRRFPPYHVLMASALLYAVRWFLYGYVSSPDWIIPLQLMNGMTFSAYFISSISYMKDIVPDELRSTGLTIFAAVFSGLGGIIGNSAGGWSIGEFGGNMTYRVGALLACIGFVFAITAFSSKHRNAGSKSLSAPGS